MGRTPSLPPVRRQLSIWYEHTRVPGFSVLAHRRLEQEMVDHGFTLDAEEPDAVVLGFDTGLTYAKLWQLCNHIRAGLPYFAMHPDFNCPTETGYMPDIGAVIAFVKASTGREPDCIIGKPNALIIRALSEKTGVPVERLVTVGDRLYTDIALGQAGLATVLVLSGETRAEDVAGSAYQHDIILAGVDELLELLQEA